MQIYSGQPKTDSPKTDSPKTDTFLKFLESSLKFRNSGCPKNPEFLIFKRRPVIENSEISYFYERSGQKYDFDENREFLAKVSRIHPLAVRCPESELVYNFNRVARVLLAEKNNRYNDR